MEELATHHFLDLSLGGEFLGMRNSALMGCMSHSAAREGGTMNIHLSQTTCYLAHTLDEEVKHMEI